MNPSWGDKVALCLGGLCSPCGKRCRGAIAGAPLRGNKGQDAVAYGPLVIGDFMPVQSTITIAFLQNYLFNEMQVNGLV
jgi:hypothetical protein